MKKNISIIALLICVNNVFSQYNYLLQGTIGKNPIVMAIHYKSDTDIAARYFYKSSLKDNFLSVEIDEAQNEFTISDEYFNDSTQQYVYNQKFVFTTKDFKTFKGNWTNNNMNQDVVLTAVDTTQINKKNYAYSNEGFEKFYSILRMQNVKLSKDSVTTKNKLTLQWFSDKESKINMFRIANGIADYKKLSRINKLLEAYQYQSLYAYYECANNNTKQGEYNYSLSEVFINNNTLNINASVNCSCTSGETKLTEKRLLINLLTGDIIQSSWQ